MQLSLLLVHSPHRSGKVLMDKTVTRISIARCVACHLVSQSICSALYRMHARSNSMMFANRPSSDDSLEFAAVLHLGC